MSGSVPSPSHQPAVVFVPGFWCSGTGVFASVVHQLRQNDIFSNIAVAALPSTGHGSPGNPSLEDDIAAVRGFIEPLVRRGQDVLLVLHSAGGIIGSASCKGLTREERVRQHLPGGVVAMAFLCAGIVPAGTKVELTSFFDIQSNYIHCDSPRETLFSDLSDADAEFWMQRMQPQPATGWDGTIEYVGYRDVACYYLLCENDRRVPLEKQKRLASLAEATTFTCPAGHMVMLSQPHEVVKFLAQVKSDIQRKELLINHF